MIKRFLSITLAMCILFAAAPVGASAAGERSGNWTDYAAKSFSGGDGTAGNPYQIATAEELTRLAVIGYEEEFDEVHFALTADIDLSAHYWTPIRFMTDGWGEPGSFNGNGHTISGLYVRDFAYAYVDRSSDDRVRQGARSAGLFSIINGLIVADLTLDSPIVAPTRFPGIKRDDYFVFDYYAGALAGNSCDSIITGCHVIDPRVELRLDDFVETWDTNYHAYIYIGGLLGVDDYDTAVLDCSASGGSVEADLYIGAPILSVGGLVGYTDNEAELLNSWTNTDVNVKAKNKAGFAIKGVETSYFTVGGLVGGSDSVINNCYSSSKITVEYSRPLNYTICSEIGGIAGYAASSAAGNYFSGSINVSSAAGDETEIYTGQCFAYTNGWIYDTYNNFYTSTDLDKRGLGKDEFNESILLTPSVSSLEGEDKPAALAQVFNTRLYEAGQFMRDSLDWFETSIGSGSWTLGYLLKAEIPGISFSLNAKQWKVDPEQNGGWPVFASPEDWPYADVSEGDWFYEAVRYNMSAGLFGGVSDTLFAPGDTLTRAMMATVLWRLEGRPPAEGMSGFDDVPDGTWYSEAVAWAAGAQIVNGIGGGLFNPEGTLTREQMAAMLARYDEYRGYFSDYSGDELDKSTWYKDVADISSWARAAFVWAVYNDMMHFREDGRLDPRSDCTRAEAADSLMNYHRLTTARDTERLDEEYYNS